MKTITVSITFSNGAWQSEIEETVHMLNSLPIVVSAERVE